MKNLIDSEVTEARTANSGCKKLRSVSGIKNSICLDKTFRKASEHYL